MSSLTTDLQPMFRITGRRLLIFGTALVFASCDGPTAPEPIDPSLHPKPRFVAEEDYTVLPNGLKLYDFVEGTGDATQTGDVVSVHYHGWLADHTLFDSSFPREEPFTFVTGSQLVIEGWEHGILGMKVDGERQLVIPPELAYGDTGRPGIPPNSTLIFELFLIERQ